MMMGALLDHPIRWAVRFGLGMGHLGLCHACPTVWPSSYWLVLVWGWGGNLRAPLLLWVAVTSQWVSCIPSVSLRLVHSRCWCRVCSGHMAPSLASVTLERGGSQQPAALSFLTPGPQCPCLPLWHPVPSSLHYEEGCGPELSCQGHPYHCVSPNDYCFLLHCAHVCGNIPGDCLVCWYDHCLIQSGLELPLTGWSVASGQPFPPFVWWSPQPSPLPSPRLPHFHSLPFRQLPWAGNMIYQGCCRGTGQSCGYASSPHGRGDPWCVVRPPDPFG